MKNMNGAEKAYIGCFIDTDGTLTMRTRTLENGRFWFETRIICFNTEEQEILRKLKEFSGVGCVTHAYRKDHETQEYKWVVTKFSDVEKLLREILPFMNLKRKKKIAELLLEFCFIRRHVRKTQHPYMKGGERYVFPQRIFEIQREITELNRKNG